MKHGQKLNGDALYLFKSLQSVVEYVLVCLLKYSREKNFGLGSWICELTVDSLINWHIQLIVKAMSSIFLRFMEL